MSSFGNIDKHPRDYAPPSAREPRPVVGPFLKTPPDPEEQAAYDAWHEQFMRLQQEGMDRGWYDITGYDYEERFSRPEGIWEYRYADGGGDA